MPPISGSSPRRRSLLLAATAVLLPTAGCSATRSRSRSHTLAELEHRFNARLGVYAKDTGTGMVVAYHADERFPMCSTYKVLTVAAILHRDRQPELARRITYTKADLVQPSPVTARHVAAGLTIEQLCQAAVSYSDSTAANLLLGQLGGPAALTAYSRSLGDHVTRLDRTEPTLNEGTPGDVRDTTSPRAMGTDYESLLLGTALPSSDRSLLTRWMAGNTTGAGRIRAGVPASAKVAEKTGTGGYGTANDIGIIWPTGRKPIVLAIMSTQSNQSAQPSDAIIAQATKAVLAAVRPSV